MRTHIRHLLAIAFFLSLASIARADLIIAPTFQREALVFQPADSIWIEFTKDHFGYSDPVKPLFNRVFSPADVGKTFVADSSTPYFLDNIALATDGVNDRVGFPNTVPYEAVFFFGAPHTPFYMGKPDLKGFTIDRVTLHVDEMIFQSNKLLDQPDLLYYTFKVTVAFEGAGSWPAEESGGGPRAAPEPTSFVIGMVGVLGVVAVRVRRSRKS